MLHSEHIQENSKICTDRIIVENYFERQCAACVVLNDRWRWSQSLFDLLFKICLALKKLHVISHPFREADGQRYIQTRNRLEAIANARAVKRRCTQEQYRDRRRRHPSIEARAFKARRDIFGCVFSEDSP